MKRALAAIAATVAGVTGVLQYRPPELPLPQQDSIDLVSVDASVVDSTTTSIAPPASSTTLPTRSSLTTTTTIKRRSTTTTTRPVATTVPQRRSYLGLRAVTEHGPIRVRVTIDGKRIVDVVAVEYPTSHTKSRELNASALPKLRQQVLTRQSGDVDAISGATELSEGYRQSVTSALDAAGL